MNERLNVPKAAITAFAVVDTGTNWRVADLCEKLTWLGSDKYRERDSERIWRQQQILAVFETRQVADEALERSQTLEKALRLMWQQAVAHELATRNIMMNMVVAELRREI